MARTRYSKRGLECPLGRMQSLKPGGSGAAAPLWGTAPDSAGAGASPRFAPSSASPAGSRWCAGASAPPAAAAPARRLREAPTLGVPLRARLRPPGGAGCALRAPKLGDRVGPPWRPCTSPASGGGGEGEKSASVSARRRAARVAGVAPGAGLPAAPRPPATLAAAPPGVAAAAALRGRLARRAWALGAGGGARAPACRHAPACAGVRLRSARPPAPSAAAGALPAGPAGAAPGDALGGAAACPVANGCSGQG